MAQTSEPARPAGKAHFNWGFCDDLTQPDRSRRSFKSIQPGSGVLK
jgi:hypothetical protein